MARRKKEQPLRTRGWLLDELRKPKVSTGSIGLTYAEIYRLGLTSMGAVEKAVSAEFPDLSKGGVTQRTRKVWDKIHYLAHPESNDRIEGSLWRVGFSNSRADFSSMQVPPRPREWSSWKRPLEMLGTLGWVQAATAEEARQLAQVSFGPVAMFNPDCLHVERNGPDGWKTGDENEKHVKKLNVAVSEIEERIAMMRWEAEQLRTLATFLGGKE